MGHWRFSGPPARMFSKGEKGEPGPELALAASAGPGRTPSPTSIDRVEVVRTRVMGLEQAVGDEYEVLLIDDVCSFLTPRLVRNVREMGREIVGVYDPVDAHDAANVTSSSAGSPM